MSSERNQEEGRPALYKRVDVRLLLDYTVNGHERIHPAITNDGYTYPEINRLLKVADSSPLLEELESYHLYTRTIVDVGVGCPSCASRRTIHDSYACPFCKSPSLKRGTLLEHYKCGHVGLMDEFAQADNLVCPKCRGVLRLIGTDYSKIQDTFRCGKCDRTFTAPSIIHLCLQCKNKFSYENARLWPVYSYEFNETHRQEVVSNCVVQLPLVNFLRERGFTVQSPGFIKGQSGIDQDFDVVARRESKNYVFTVATSANEVTQDTVATLFGKRFDVQAERAFVVAIPRMNQEGLKMAQLYGISVIEGIDHAEIMEKIPPLLQSTNESKPISSDIRRPSVPSEHADAASSLMETVQRLTNQLTGQIRTQFEPTLIRPPQRQKESQLPQAQRESILTASIASKNESTPSIPRNEPARLKISEETRCTHCGRSLVGGSKFCDQCGRLLN